MLLRRVGKKLGLLAKEIQSHFPNNFNIWIEPFFGAGGMFFSLEKECQYYLVSDSDKEVFNFFLVFSSDIPVLSLQDSCFARLQVPVYKNCHKLLFKH